MQPADASFLPPPNAASPAPQPVPLVSAIIVSYNTRDLTLRCLSSLKAALSAIPHEIILVDNASSDGSPDAVAAAHPDIHLIRHPANAGFGAANNLGMARARGTHFLLINTDAFAEPGAVAALLAAANRHPNAAVIGPRLLNADGSLQRSCYRFPSPLHAWLDNLGLARLLHDYSRWPHDAEQDVDWLIGACMLVRKDAYAAVGGFDPRFFMYAEETDWQKSLRRAGYSIVFTPTAQVTHLGGASGNTEKKDINESFFRSYDLYTLKHHGPLGFLFMRAAMILGCSLRSLAWTLKALLQPASRPQSQTKSTFHRRLLRRQLTPLSPPLSPGRPA